MKTLVGEIEFEQASKCQGHAECRVDPDMRRDPPACLGVGAKRKGDNCRMDEQRQRDWTGFCMLLVLIGSAVTIAVAIGLDRCLSPPHIADCQLLMGDQPIEIEQGYVYTCRAVDGHILIERTPADPNESTGMDRRTWKPDPNASYTVEFGRIRVPTRARGTYEDYWPVDRVEMPQETRTHNYWITDPNGNPRLVFEN